MNGLVYINWGRPVVDCPFGCGNAYLYEGQSSRNCNGPGGCNYEFGIVSPDNLGELMTELSRRPVEANRNWFPEGHPLAVRADYPMGQSVTDLALEYEYEVTGNGVE